LTIVNYTLIGLASGLVLAGGLGVASGQPRFVAPLGAWAVAITTLAWLTRTLALRRNAKLKPKSTLQSATGIEAPDIVQKSMGMTGGAFNTREFFHRASVAAFRRMRVVFQVFAFAVPLALVACAVISGWSAAWLLAVPIQLAGVLAERWFFFAQARHPQNLYYQVVSLRRRGKLARAERRPDYRFSLASERTFLVSAAVEAFMSRQITNPLIRAKESR